MEFILIADQDLGFVFWLGAALGEAGFMAFPAQNARRAASVARRVEVNLLIADPALPGTADLVTLLRRVQPQAKIIAATEGPADGVVLPPGFDGCLAKPDPADDAARNQWMDQVLSLAGYSVLVH